MTELGNDSLKYCRDPWEMLKDGDFSHIELMMGTNQDEGNNDHFILLSHGKYF